MLSDFFAFCWLGQPKKAQKAHMVAGGGDASMQCPHSSDCIGISQAFD